jgi:hypothetical protein
MSFDHALEQGMLAVPDCIAAAYVDMSTGLLLGAKHMANYGDELLAVVAAATADLFQGQNVSAIEDLWRRYRRQAQDGKHYFQEFFVTSENTLHIFLRGKRYPNHAIVFICRKSANIGMVISKSRGTLESVEAAL